MTDSTDEGALQWLRDLRRGSSLPVVLVTGRADPADLVRLVESGLAGVLSRVEATAERLVRAVRLAAAGRASCRPRWSVTCWTRRASLARAGSACAGALAAA